MFIKNNKKSIILVFILGVSLFASMFATASPGTEWKDTYTLVYPSDISGSVKKVGVPTFVIMPNQTTIWCVYEVRYGIDGGDFEEGDIYISKSYDTGTTWETPECFIDSSVSFSGHACSNPSFVWNGSRLWFIFTERWSSYSSRVYIRYSDNNGSTWSNNIKIHDASGTKMFGCNYFVAGQGNGVIANDGHIIFSGFAKPDANYDAVLVYSTGDGTSVSDWYDITIIDGSVQGKSFSECSIVNLTNNTLYSVHRDMYDGIYQCWSENNGLTWTDPSLLYNVAVPSLVTITRLTTIENGYQKNRVVMAWNNDFGANANYRYNITVSLSTDDCATWAYTRLVDANRSGATNNYERIEYPGIIAMPNKTIMMGYSTGMVYGNPPSGTTGKWKRLNISTFNVEWITQGGDWIDEADATPPQITSFNSGSNGSFFHTGTPAIKWTLEANAVSFHLQASTDNTFSSIVIDISDINEYIFPSHYSENLTHATFILPSEYRIANVNSYYWRVISYK